MRGTVVDAGCGEGYGAALLGAIGLDVDAATVAHARTRYGPRFVRADIMRLPLGSGSVDAVVALQVLEHLTEPRAFLERCAAALRPGGMLILSTPNRETFPAGLNPFHPREYDALELRDLLAGAFGDVRLLGLGHGPWLRWVDRRLGEPIQHRLTRSPHPEQPLALRAALRAVRARHFTISARPAGSLDLLAVCRSIER